MRGLPPGPMARQGNPKSGTCRHCNQPKMRSKSTGILFCFRCDAAEVNGRRAGDPTWMTNGRTR